MQPVIISARTPVLNTPGVGAGCQSRASLAGESGAVAGNNM